MTRSNNRACRAAGAVAVGVTVALTLAACGGSTATNAPAGGGQQTKAVEAAQANLAKYMDTKPPTPPGPPFDASAARGKFVELVLQKGANPAVASVASSITAGLEHQGVTVRSCDAKGVSVDISTCIRQGLSQKADAVIVDGGDPAAYSAGLKAAQDAKVPLVSALDLPLASEINNSGVKPAADLLAKLKDISSNAAPPDALSGTLMADYIIANSKGNPKGLFIESPGIVGSDYLKKAFDAEMAKQCPGCQFDSKAVEITNWAKDLGAVVAAYLAQTPDAQYVVPVFDPMAAYTDPAIRSAGKAGSVKVVTANGSLQQMQELAQGGGVLAADAGQDLPEVGYIAADQTLRLLTGQPVSQGAAGASRMFTDKNIGSVPVTANASTTGEWFTGSADALSSLYYKLWSGKP